MASTQLESTHTREVFPCFDEPELKATFDISLGRSGDYSTLANGVIKEVEDEYVRDYLYKFCVEVENKHDLPTGTPR